jgi:hypothetical protein
MGNDVALFIERHIWVMGHLPYVSFRVGKAEQQSAKGRRKRLPQYLHACARQTPLQRPHLLIRGYVMGQRKTTKTALASGSG